MQGLEGTVKGAEKGAECSALLLELQWSLEEISSPLYLVKQFCGGFSKVSPKPDEGEIKRQALPHAFYIFFFFNNEGWIVVQLLLGRTITGKLL